MSNNSEQTVNDQDASQIMLPRDSYWIRCIEGNRKMSQSSNAPTLYLTWELCDNEKCLDENDRPINPNGLRVQSFHSLQPKALNFINQMRSSAQLDPLTEEELDEQDGQSYVGVVALAIIGCKKVEELNDVTKQPIVNKRTGEPVTRVQRNILQWLS